MQQSRFVNNSSQLNMFRALIPPIFRSTTMCVKACDIIHPPCCRPVAWKRSSSPSRLPGRHYTTSCNTQSSAPEDGCDHCLQHVELTGIINKPLLLYLVGVYIIYVNDAWSNKYQILTLFGGTKDNHKRDKMRIICAQPRFTPQTFKIQDRSITAWVNSPSS